MVTTSDACDWSAIGSRGNRKAAGSECQLLAESNSWQLGPADVQDEVPYGQAWPPPQPSPAGEEAKVPPIAP
jgi:hypothetical protein